MHSTLGKADQLIELGGEPWAKVFKSKYFANVRFLEKYWYEDSILRQIIYPFVVRSGGSAYSISELVYNYYSANPVNITNTARYKSKSIDSYYITKGLLTINAQSIVCQ